MHLMMLLAQDSSSYTWGQLRDILVMQGFAGISLFSVFLLMSLGLAVIFGQMGVINMAHGEFMTVGAYITAYMSQIVSDRWPGLLPWFFPAAVIASFIVAFIIGWIVEVVLIRHLYRRPLDTLLATWGVSMVMQQAFRSIFGARETSATLPDWLTDAWDVTDTIEIPHNGIVLLLLSLVVCLLVYLLLYRSRWGLQVRATTLNRPIAGAVGINTKWTDRLTFGLGCGLAGIAGAGFVMIGSVSPTAGSSYIVDTFIVVVFGGTGSLIGTAISSFTIGQAQSILAFFTSGVLAKVFVLLGVVILLMIRPQGLVAGKVRR
jgi:urea transport system permease protein